MIIRCVRVVPSRQQAERLGKHYLPGKQEFGIVRGQEYMVYALRMLGGEPWVDITDPDMDPGYLFGVPLCLFEFTDPRVPSLWEARLSESGELQLAPPSFFQKYYRDDLFEGVPEIVHNFRRVREQLLRE